MSQITQYDWNNLTIPALRPASGGKINYVDEPGFPGLKNIFDQHQDEWKNLRNKMDADFVGQGIQFGNIGNGAVQPENIRPNIGQPIIDKPFAVQTGAGSYFLQTDGQPQLYVEFAKWQQITNFRNFVNGVDNVNTELNIIIAWDYFSAYSGVQGATNHPTWYNAPADYNQYKNLWILVEVASDSAFTTPITVANEGFFTRNGPCDWKVDCVDSNPKNFQNPWYRVRFYMKKGVNQGVGTSMQHIGVGTTNVTAKVTNKKLL